MLTSNSSTIILLAKISLLSKLLDEVKNIAITNVVHEEVLNKDSFENLIIKKEISQRRIKIDFIKEKFYANAIKQFKIDKGEASTFALCANKKYEGILTDDRELIKLCKIQEIKFTSSMAIVVILYKKKKINKKGALEKMEQLQGYGMFSSDIYNYFKNMVN